MAFETDRAIVRQAVARDPALAGLDLSAPLADMDASQTRDAFLLAAMRVLACGGNGHSRVIPNAAIRVWPVRIVARGADFVLIDNGVARALHAVNGEPVEAVLDRLRPCLAGTAARQTVIGGLPMAWPAAIGTRDVTYTLGDGTLAYGPDALVPVAPLYPRGEVGGPDPDTDQWARAAPVHWDAPVWHIRIARLDVDLPDGLADAVLDRPDANIVIDLRGNAGGSFLRVLPIIAKLRAGWQGRRVAVCVDRFTFSAAIVSAVLFQHHLGARLFGEAMGDGLQFWAEGDTIDLPETGAHVRWSNAWHDWETGLAHPTTPPEIAAHLVAAGPLQITPCADGSAARAWAAG
ncbi:MAG: hypothetical protein AAFQ59_09230 [Pseudomonadota bacterium]